MRPTSDGFFDFDARLIGINPAQLLIGEKVDVIGRIDRLGYSVDLVRDYREHSVRIHLPIALLKFHFETINVPGKPRRK